MPARPRSHDSGEGGARPHGVHSRAAQSVRHAEEVVGDESKAGRPGLGHSRAAASTDRFTQQTGQRGNTPDGHPTRSEQDDDAPTQRSIEMENSAAAVLADNGWQIKQNPTADEIAQARLQTGDSGNPRKKPDYLLEGRVFDCYSPTHPTKDVRGIWSEVRKKIVNAQTQRVVVNLADWRGDVSAVRQQFAEWPIEGLKEVKAITPEGDIIQISLEPDRHGEPD